MRILHGLNIDIYITTVNLIYMMITGITYTLTSRYDSQDIRYYEIIAALLYSSGLYILHYQSISIYQMLCIYLCSNLLFLMYLFNKKNIHYGNMIIILIIGMLQGIYRNFFFIKNSNLYVISIFCFTFSKIFLNKSCKFRKSLRHQSLLISSIYIILSMLHCYIFQENIITLLNIYYNYLNVFKTDKIMLLPIIIVDRIIMHINNDKVLFFTIIHTFLILFLLLT